ncbi:unnamed protein product [Acanthosepion pharaonis]|uniref:Uncharacterized protein n=1 Tax=Acanthosepion pharaonis TaxID=158019 RepID=A0A812BKV4_ACAPH|nr:unnamed protein product [Sepia pharaonis]
MFAFVLSFSCSSCFFKEGTLCNSIRLLFFHCNLPFCGFCLVLRHISSAAFTSLSNVPVCDFLRYSRTTFINQSSLSIFLAFIYLYLLHLFLLSSPWADNNIDSVCCYSFFFLHGYAHNISFAAQFLCFKNSFKIDFFLYSYEIYSHIFFLSCL